MSIDRLSALDASFLYLDGPCTPMHISSLAVYEGPPPQTKELMDVLVGRLHLVPRFRQRLASVPFNGHRPAWVPDPRFDISSHVQRVRLPDTGSDDELMHVVGYMLSQPLTKSRPLWEMCLIEGLSDDRFAVLSKTHHSLWDGISGADIHSVLLDATPDAPDEPGVSFEQRRAPGGVEMIAAAARDRITEGIGSVRGVLGALRKPRRTIRQIADVATGAVDLASSLLRQAPRMEINGRIGSGRRFAVARSSLDDVKGLKSIVGASVNDAILAAVAGGLRRWQVSRGVDPHDVKVMVPVSVRGADEHDTLGNRVVMLVVPLPVGIRDPLVRLDRIHEVMTKAKASHQARAGDAILKMSSALPPFAVAGLSQLQSRYRSFNLLVTNVPGPQFPLYLLGRKLVELYPQAPLVRNQGLSIGAMSYDGKLGFGLLGDLDLLPDLGMLAGGVQDAMDEILWTVGHETVMIPEPIPGAMGELVTIG
ncbi:MAG: wax ester/triacylglycerol synthase family O-acyltransferase [Actinomycetota bacterium]